jgi:hypothetical protein
MSYGTTHDVNFYALFSRETTYLKSFGTTELVSELNLQF